MVLLEDGLNKIRDIHKANIDKGQMGTDGTAESESQTGLQTPVAASKQDVTITSTNKTNVINYTLPSTAGTGSTYREFTVMLDGDTEYNRRVFTGVEHTSSEDVIVRQTIVYRNP